MFVQFFENVIDAPQVSKPFGFWNYQNGNTVKIRNGRAAVCIRCALLQIFAASFHCPIFGWEGAVKVEYESENLPVIA